MGAVLLSFLAIEAQYICTAVLVLICTLAGAHLYLMHVRKTDKPQTTADPPEPQGEGPAEELSEEEFPDGEELPDEEDGGEIPEAELPEENGEGIAVLPVSGKTPVRGRYNKSFTAKLIQSSDAVKQYYVDLANELFSYEKVRNRISWANSSFSIGRKAVSKFSIRGKTLFLYLALEPNEFLDSKYFITDESAVKRYETVPLRMKIKSPRGVKFGKELIGILMQKSGVTRAEGKVEQVKLSDYPYDTTKNLLARGLILLKTEEGQPMADSDRLVWAGFETREQVSVAEVGNLIPDEVAVSFVEEKEETVLSKPRGIINIDTLSEHYQANETVTLESLKEKKLIGNSVNHVKVLARGVLNKPLIVKMPEFSVDAVKMILLTGGKAIKLKTQN